MFESSYETSFMSKCHEEEILRSWGKIKRKNKNKKNSRLNSFLHLLIVIGHDVKRHKTENFS